MVGFLLRSKKIKSNIKKKKIKRPWAFHHLHGRLNHYARALELSSKRAWVYFRHSHPALVSAAAAAAVHPLPRCLLPPRKTTPGLLALLIWVVLCPLAAAVDSSPLPNGFSRVQLEVEAREEAQEAEAQEEACSTTLVLCRACLCLVAVSLYQEQEEEDEEETYSGTAVTTSSGLRHRPVVLRRRRTFPRSHRRIPLHPLRSSTSSNQFRISPALLVCPNNLWEQLCSFEVSFLFFFCFVWETR